MFIKAQQKYLRISPRKVRLVVNAIKDLQPKLALEQLLFMQNAAAIPLSKVIRQALANAVRNADLKEENLKFKSIQVGAGPTLKRWQPVSRGRAHTIYKRTSHITVLLESTEPGKLAKTAPLKKTKTVKKTALAEKIKERSKHGTKS